MSPLAKVVVRDVAERMLWTFLEAFLGVLLVSPIFGISSLQAAAAAGMAAALTYAKSTLALLKEGTLSPGSTVKVPDQIGGA